MRILITMAVLALAGAAQADDVAKGQALARENCVRCHDVEPGGAAKMHPPSFAAIAAFRPKEQIVARIWYPSLHSAMPQMLTLLSRENVADLTAYILSLE